MKTKRGKLGKVFLVLAAWAAVLGGSAMLQAVASRGPLHDVLPQDTGFNGAFSHQADDSFNFGFSNGTALSISRQGAILSLQDGLNGKGRRINTKEGGRLAQLKDENHKLVLGLVYDKDGKVVGIRGPKGEVFNLAYGKAKKGLVRIEFPNHKRGIFPAK